MLKQRLITAAILIPLVLWLLFYSSPWVFAVATALMMLAAAVEWTSLMQLNTLWERMLYLVFIFYAIFVLFIVGTPVIFVMTFFWWLAALVLVLIYPRASAWWGKSTWVKGLMGGLVLAPCWFALNTIRVENGGIQALFFVFILIWGADTTAYFVGRKWGKTKLIPDVSPGKSLEGVCGALVFAIVVTAFAVQGPLAVRISAIVLSLMTVLFSILGDLFESMLKRQAGVKDSGTILPGHGGILDRIDSLTAAAPVYALGVFLLSMYFSGP